MSEILDIPSLLNGSKWFYRLHYSRCDLQTYGLHERPLCDALGLCETYGDGMCQHAPERLVFMENWVDALMSVAKAAYDHTDEKPIQDLYWLTGLRCSDSELKFYLDLKYRDHKETYYSKDIEKVSTSEKLKYDKRYERVPTTIDGSMPQAYALYVNDHPHTFMIARWAVWERMIYLCGSIYPRPQWMKDASGDEWDNISQYNNAFQALKCAADMASARQSLKSGVDHYIERIRNEANEKAALENPAVAIA